MRILEAVLGQRLSALGARVFRVEREIDLLIPVEWCRGVRKGVVAVAAPGRWRAMSEAWAAILYVDDPNFTSSLIGKPKCSFGVT